MCKFTHIYFKQLYMWQLIYIYIYNIQYNRDCIYINTPSLAPEHKEHILCD